MEISVLKIVIWWGKTSILWSQIAFYSSSDMLPWNEISEHKTRRFTSQMTILKTVICFYTRLHPSTCISLCQNQTLNTELYRVATLMQKQNSLTFPWPNSICKIPWLFPDLEEKSHFPDFSLTSGHPEKSWIDLFLFCCLTSLSTTMVMSRRSANLIIFFQGRLRPKQLTSTSPNDNCPTWIR